MEQVSSCPLQQGAKLRRPCRDKPFRPPRWKCYHLATCSDSWGQLCLFRQPYSFLRPYHRRRHRRCHHHHQHHTRPRVQESSTAPLLAGCKLGCWLSSADSPSLSHLFPFRSPPTRFPAPCAAPLISLSFPALLVAASGGGKQLRYLGAQSCKLVSSCRDLWRCHHSLFCSAQGRWASLV